MSGSISPRRRGSAPVDRCEIEGCGEEAVRSIARSELKKAFPNLSGDRGRMGVCRAHYKQYKKATKGERELDRLGW